MNICLLVTSQSPFFSSRFPSPPPHSFICPYPLPASLSHSCTHTHTQPHTHLLDDPGAQSASGAHSPSCHRCFFKNAENTAKFQGQRQNINTNNYDQLPRHALLHPPRLIFFNNSTASLWAHQKHPILDIRNV